MALGSLARVVERVQAAMDAGAMPAGDATSAAVGMWACEHGMVSREARMAGHVDFDWDHIAPAIIAAVVRGVAVAAPQD